MEIKYAYPGFVRKAITFTIDDGNIPLDTKFIRITSPYGFRGTFNLNTPLSNQMTPEQYRAFYRGYEISNHCRYHALPFSERLPRSSISDTYFSTDLPRERGPIYPIKDKPGLYHSFCGWWATIAEDDNYMVCVESCQTELEEVFGKENVKGYCWPCGAQPNEEVTHRLLDCGFLYLRNAGTCGNRTGYSLPADRNNWTYNGDCSNMPETGAEYESLPDDGTLKFYCFGVHSSDFENARKWDMLEEFCKKYGNRPNDFWYAPVGEIFEYEDALHALIITDNAVTNPSRFDVCLEIDGKKITVFAGRTVTL